MTREELTIIIENLRLSGSSEDALVADHIEDILVVNVLEPWKDVQERVKSSIEEVRSAASFVLEQSNGEPITTQL